MLKEGLDAKEAFVGNQAGDARAAHRRSGEEGRGGLQLSLPEPRHHGADERDGALDARPLRGLDADAERRGRARRGGRGRGPAASAMRRLQASISAAASAGAATSHDYVRQAVLIAKEMPGTPVKLIWSREEDMLHGRYHPITQCKLVGALDDEGQPDRRCTCASPASRSWPRVRPEALQNGRDPVVFQGLNAGGRGGRRSATRSRTS